MIILNVKFILIILSIFYFFFWKEKNVDFYKFLPNNYAHFHIVTKISCEFENRLNLREKIKIKNLCFFLF